MCRRDTIERRGPDNHLGFPQGRSHPMTLKHQFRPTLEGLEERWVPANIKLVHGNLYVSRQFGPLTIETQKLPGEILVSDGHRSTLFTGVTNRIQVTGTKWGDAINVLANESPFAGDVVIYGGKGPDSVKVQAS